MPLVSTTDGWHYQLDGFLMNAFVYSDGDTHLALNNGKIEMTAIKPEFKEGLKYLNKLCARRHMTHNSRNKQAAVYQENARPVDGMTFSDSKVIGIQNLLSLKV